MRPIIGIFLCAVAIAFASWANPAPRNQGILEIRIKDHRDAIDDFTKLRVVLDKILISPKPGLKFWQSGWHELALSSDSVDLTQYVGKKALTLFRGAMDAGSFDALQLRIKRLEAQLKKTRRATPVKNTVSPIKLSFEVKPQAETLLIIDLTVMDMSDHAPRGYELGLQGYELYFDGKLLEKIPPG